MMTPLGYNLVGDDSSEVFFNKVLLDCSFDLVFEPIEHNSRKLVDIHLLAGVYGFAFIVFECVAECSGVVVLLLALFESNEQRLELVKQILFRLGFLELGVLHCEHSFSERRNHKRLLQKAVHVANTAEVLDPHIACRRLFIHFRSYDPVCESFCSPLAFDVELGEELDHPKEISLVKAHQSLCQFECHQPSRSRFSFW